MRAESFAAGPNKHVGVVLGIDEEAPSFTVLDAQMNQPITFLAEEGLLASLKDVKGQVLVNFEPEGSKLRATSIDSLSTSIEAVTVNAFIERTA